MANCVNESVLVLDEEVVTHTVRLKKTRQGYSCEARVIVALEVDGKRYKFNKVVPIFLRKDKEVT